MEFTAEDYTRIINTLSAQKAQTELVALEKTVLVEKLQARVAELETGPEDPETGDSV